MNRMIVVLHIDFSNIILLHFDMEKINSGAEANPRAHFLPRGLYTRLFVRFPWYLGIVIRVEGLIIPLRCIFNVRLMIRCSKQILAVVSPGIGICEL